MPKHEYHENHYEVKQKFENGEIVLEDLELHHTGQYHLTGRHFSKYLDYFVDLVFKFPGYAGKATFGFSESSDGKTMPKMYIDMTPLCEKFDAGEYSCIGNNVGIHGCSPETSFVDEKYHTKEYHGTCMDKIAEKLSYHPIDLIESLGISLLFSDKPFEFSLNKPQLEFNPFKKYFAAFIKAAIELKGGLKVIQPEELSKLEEEAKKPYITKEGIEIFAKYVDDKVYEIDKGCIHTSKKAAAQEAVMQLIAENFAEVIKNGWI